MLPGGALNKYWRARGLSFRRFGIVQFVLGRVLRRDPSQMIANFRQQPDHSFRASRCLMPQGGGLLLGLLKALFVPSGKGI